MGLKLHIDVIFPLTLNSNPSRGLYEHLNYIESFDFLDLRYSSIFLLTSTSFSKLGTGLVSPDEILGLKCITLI
jgi:hypothetical protein